MVDADDPAIGRVDEKTDPSAMTESEIRRELRENPNLQGDAVRAFAEEISQKREPVQQEAREVLRNSIQPNPANPEILQIRNSKGQLDAKIPDTRRGEVSLDVDNRGDVIATIDGEQIEVGSVDLDAGADHPGVGSYQRSLDRYSKRKHPEQRPG